MKTFEAKDSTVHLCMHCCNRFPDCESRIRFGDGCGDDNIRGCTSFDEDPCNEVDYEEIEMSDEEFENKYE